jgi:hypothetical protein
MDTNYAPRMLAHLTDKADYCRACGDKCIQCRKKYRLDFSKSITGIIDFPAVLPGIIEEPEEFLPEDIPEHDILIAIAVNEEILISFINKFRLSRGIIVPIEQSACISPNAVAEITGICAQAGIEVSFPKPFCSFAPKEGILSEFRKEFKIGKPEVRFDIQNKVIAGTEVIVSAPCGATYHTCRGLEGRDMRDDLEYIIDGRLSSYPCTADTSIDAQFKDSITHEAVKLQRSILASIRNHNI